MIRHRSRATTTAMDSRRGLTQAGLLAAAIGLLLTVPTESSPGDELAISRRALVAGADRLAALQRPDGTWPVIVGLPEGDLGITGDVARALLRAHVGLGEERWLAAAARAAVAIEQGVGRTPGAATPANLLFLAEFGRVSGRPDLVELAARVRLSQVPANHRIDGRAAGAAFMDRVNRTRLREAAWRNLLLAEAAERSLLARAVGEEAWADDFMLGASLSWAPKHDDAWWVVAAGRTLEALALVPGTEARRLSGAHLGQLRRNEMAPGLPWSDTPYDTYTYTHEAGAALTGLLACRDAEAAEAARRGLALLASRQAPSGGWGEVISLLPGRPPDSGPDAVPASELAVGETPQANATLVLALVRVLSGERALPPAHRRVARATAPAGPPAS